MKTLSVESFSTIKHAHVELGRLTVLIGPQASGKSLISKLIYFCNTILNRHLGFIERDKSVEAFQSSIAGEFDRWFPPLARGASHFKITFNIGPFQYSLEQAKPEASLSVTFSDAFRRVYDENRKLWNTLRRKLADQANPDLTNEKDLEIVVRFRGAARASYEKILGNDYYLSQVFIPAGRSYFTTLGGLISAFEQPGLLDSVTRTFGRRYLRIRERLRDPRFSKRMKHSSDLVREFFGGAITYEGDAEFISTPDGRKLPFSLLSSGQQELLPLLMTLDDSRAPRTLVFIEEPEAHLFPTGQTMLTKHLASLVRADDRSAHLFITTHSPYVLAQINNLMKAGTLAKKLPTLRKRIAHIVAERSWLDPGDVRAYALHEGECKSLLADGLIDAVYLDEVSSAISTEFSELLELEIENED